MMSSLRWMSAVLSLSMSVFSMAQPPASEAPTKSPAAFTNRTDLVLVPVIVTDGKGRHVSGLKEGAFSLEENGKPQTLSVFEEVVSRRIEPGTAAPEMPGFTNYAAGDTQPRSMTILVLDLLNTPFLDQAETRSELIKYLSKSLPNDEPITVLGIDSQGLRQLHSFTTDTKVLIAALSKVKGKVSLTETNDTALDSTTPSASLSSLLNPELEGTVDQFDAFFSEAMTDFAAMDQRDATRRTLAALNQIAQAYSGIPGRKAVLWATAGFPFMIDDSSAINYMGLEMVKSYQQTWRALMSANIAIYPVDVQGALQRYSNRSFYPFTTANGSSSSRGGPTSASDINQRNLRQWNRALPYDRHQQQQSTLLAFAAATGGTACLNLSDLAKCFENATVDSSSYYMLGFYLSPDDLKQGWRHLKVQAAASGAHVRAREGFYVGGPPKDDEQTRRAALVAALTSPVEYTGVPMNVQWTGQDLPKTAAKDKTVKMLAADFSVTLPASLFSGEGPQSGMMDLLFTAIAFDNKGKSVGEITREMTGKLKPESIARIRREGFNFQSAIDYPEGTKEVRFAIRNNATGQIGTVIAPVISH
jgi:VWFA-related protein